MSSRPRIHPRRGAGPRLVPALSGVLMLALAGCYQTAELPTPSPAPDTRIVAYLTPNGEDQMAPWIGSDAVQVEGRVLTVRPDALDLAILRVEHRGSAPVPWKGQQVTFPQGTLEAMRERSLDGRRTALFTAALGTGLVLLARTFLWSESTQDSRNPDPDPVF